MKLFTRGISLKAALLALFAVVTVAAVALVGLFSYYTGKRAVNDVALQLRAEVVERINEHVQDYLLLPHQINHVNARAIALDNGLAQDQEALSARFAEQVDLFPTLTSISFGNALGGLANSGREPRNDSRYVIVTDRFQAGTFRKIALDSDARQDREIDVLTEFDARTRPWYKLAQDKGGPVYSDIYILFTGQDMSLAASSPVYDRQDNFLGVLSIDLFLGHLSEFLRDLDIGNQGQAVIMERSGDLVASSKGRVLMVDKVPSLSRRVQGVESEVPAVREAVRSLMFRFEDLDAIQEDHFLDFKVQGRKHLLQVSSLKVDPGIDWLVAVSMPEEDFMAGFAAQNRITILITLAVLGLALLAGMFVTRGIVRPVSLLERAAGRLTSGYQPEEIAEKSRFVEVRNLTRSFNQMSRKVSDSILKLNNELAERRRAEESLRESQERMQAVTDSAHDAIIMMGPDGEISYWNPMAESIFGYTAQEVMGKSLHHLLAPERYHTDITKAMPEFQRTGQGNAVGKTIELSAIGKDGLEIPISLSMSSVLLQGRWHAVGIARDISRRKAAEKELIQAKEQAEAANIAKSKFLANMSHELRTPFNGIMGMMQLLQTTDLNGEQQEFVNLAIQSSERFVRLLSDILELSNIEAGKMSICSAEFRTGELLDSLSDLFSAEALKKGIVLEFSMEPDVPEQVSGDKTRVKQVMFTLVGNALKFTESGSVQVHLTSISGAKGGDTRLKFSVSDTGIGIPDDKLSTLFNPFVQVDGSYTRKYQGAGLGLSLVKRLVDMMNGNISVESEVDRGTTVHVVLPFTLPAVDHLESVTAATTKPESKKYLDILLAEDDRLNQLFMKTMLEKQGHNVLLANNGQEAVDLFQEQNFDCILMDIQMPVMTGVEATQRIRSMEQGAWGPSETPVYDREPFGLFNGAGMEHGAEVRGQRSEIRDERPTAEVRIPESLNSSIPQSPNPRIPIIAVTAHTQPGDRERFLEAGMDDYIGKPVNNEDFQRVFSKFFGQEYLFSALHVA
ncbi:ATP-binding protein, partial [Desulfonatronospira sp. MSAO_Bac3]|uniref:ATP-binding protein n=1 Tax=Desulfonatronospira sp. MSAO_Bac3 TaxID=2293857 RepID=UPI000FF855C0